MYRSMNTPRLIASIVLIIILGVVFGITVSNNRKIINRCSGTTTGVVTSYSPSKKRGSASNHSSVTGTLTVAYEVRGVTYSCQGLTSGAKNPGTHVQVHYNPGTPSEAYADRGPVTNKTPMYAAIGVSVVVYIGATVVLGKKSY